MKIIIVGLGQTGTLLAELISKDGHDIVVIDKNKSSVDHATNQMNVNGVCGSGASRDILMKAGADTADAVIALTPYDEINLLCCMMAKKCGTRYSATRLQRNDLSNDKHYFQQEFGIDCIVNSKQETALEIVRQINLPGSIKADGFFGESTAIIELTLEKDHPWIGKSLREIKASIQHPMLVGAVYRENKVLIPDGQFTMEPGDIVSIILPEKSVSRLHQMARRTVKNVLIVGCGTTGSCLIEKLLEQKKNITVIDNDQKRCEELSERFPTIKVALGNGIEMDTLYEEGIKSMDSCVSMTGSEENNLVISMFAWTCNLYSIVTRVNTPAYERLLHKVNMDITISPSIICTERLMGFVRNIAVYNENGVDIKRFYRIFDGMAECIEFIAYENCMKLGIPLMDSEFKLKKGIILGAILRDDTTIIPSGQDCIKQGDHVVVITKPKQHLHTLNDIFA